MVASHVAQIENTAVFGANPQTNASASTYFLQKHGFVIGSGNADLERTL